MYFLNRLFQPIVAFFRVLISPLTNLTYGLRNLRTNNPIAQFMRMVASQRQRLDYYRGLPGMYGKAFSIRTPKWLRGNKYFAAFRESLPEFSFRQRSQEDLIRIERGAKLPQVAQHSQIHLIDQRSGERHILHIGTEIGKSTAEITLNKGVRLRFRQIDPSQYNAHMMVAQIDGKTKVLIDEQPLNRGARIFDESVISIDKTAYTCEMYAWARFPEEVRTDATWATTTGPVRPRNEDAIGIFQRREGYMFVVADGVGGGYAGDEVSRFAVQYLLAVFDRNITYDLPWSEIYERAYENINAEVRKFILKSPDIAGTTLTAMVIKGWDAYIAHVGDTRLYHLQGGVMEQVTVDHSLQSESGDKFYDLTSTPEKEEVLFPDARYDDAGRDEPGRTTLTRAIGKSDYITVDFYTRRIQPGDRFLLCTDGVWASLETSEIEDTLRLKPIAAIPEYLIGRAYEESGDDNATAVVVDVLKEAYERDRWKAKTGERVFAGQQPARDLRLRKPRELETDYGTSPAGCAFWLIVIAAVIALGVWGIPRLTNNAGSNDTANDALTTIDETLTDEPTATEMPVLTDTPQVTVVTGTPTLTPTITRTPTPSVTAQPRTPLPTFTPTVPTPIPPTATLRAALPLTESDVVLRIETDEVRALNTQTEFSA